MAEEIQQILKNADAVCFDVDSTVIQEEGIDELAAFCNKGKEVAELYVSLKGQSKNAHLKNYFRTAKAMTGTMTFQEALKLRLDIIKPSLSQVKEFIRTRPPTLTPGVKCVRIITFKILSNHIFCIGD